MVKRRYILGGIFSALAVGGALALDLIGPVDPPKPLVLQFSRGAALAQGEEARLAAYAGQHMAEQKVQFHVLGHTGGQGDAEANQNLSQQRADIVAAALVDAGVAVDRILSAKGVGSADPLPKDGDESDRQHQRRMSRAVVTAVVRK
ncbi:MAG: OmpA family protein [Pseudomonadota bacterium]